MGVAMIKTVKLGTRGSLLACKQSELVARMVEAAGVGVELEMPMAVPAWMI